MSIHATAGGANELILGDERVTDAILLVGISSSTITAQEEARLTDVGGNNSLTSPATYLTSHSAQHYRLDAFVIDSLFSLRNNCIFFFNSSLYKSS